MERLDRLRLSSVAHARYAPSSSIAVPGKDTSRIHPSHFSDGLLGRPYSRRLGVCARPKLRISDSETTATSTNLEQLRLAAG
ncbi:MAG: hypothetical protein KTR25_13900 [Myxococcales bacterium]|nr:hypothetical protein [Myxococcales bacterium]